MQLLNLWALNIFITALLISGGIALFAAWLVWRHTRDRPLFLHVLTASAAFSLLGFVVGQLTGVSREAAVGTVVPAALTLVGGAAAFLMEIRGVGKRLAVSGLLLCFTSALLAGSLFGLRLRIEYLTEIEQPERLRQRDLALEFAKRSVEVQRLENYLEILMLQRDLSAQKEIDLSRFEHAYEKKSRDKGQ